MQKEERRRETGKREERDGEGMLVQKVIKIGTLIKHKIFSKLLFYIRRFDIRLVTK